MMDAVVTTSRTAGPEEVERARRLAARLAIPFAPRQGALADLGARAALVVTKDRLVVETRAGKLFFHPGMARPRIRSLERGEDDVMIKAMQLASGDAVLDCTLGLGADAIVSAFVVGRGGRVVGVEAVPLLAEVVRIGLQTYDPGHEAMRDAMRRVEVVAADHADYLARLPDAAFDVVYLDPLFREPVEATVHMRPWRELGVGRPLTKDIVAQARRVAKRRVVIKERQGSPVFDELGVDAVVGGRKSRVAYGIITAGDGPSVAVDAASMVRATSAADGERP